MSASGTIIIPAHNEQDFIINLLESLKVHLKKPTQIIVVANACTDATANNARGYDCEVIEIAQKQDPSTARNKGVEYAYGDIFAFLDADVEVTEKWCSAFQGLLDSTDKNSLILTGDQCHISKNPSWIEKNWFFPLRELPKSYINSGNLIASRELFVRINGFDSSLETGEDVDFCRRAVDATAELIINPSFIVFHEGFPKTMRRFLKRERWHGKGDFQQFSHLVRSKTALLTVVFTFIHGLLLILIPIAIYQCSKTSLVALVVLVAATCVIRFKSLSILRQPSILAVQYIYFLGRGLSFLDTIKTKLTRKV